MSVKGIAIGEVLHVLSEHAERIVIKLDVEDYELPLMDALAQSGALCTPKLTDLFIESGLLGLGSHILNRTACGQDMLPPTVKLQRWA